VTTYNPRVILLILSLAIAGEQSMRAVLDRAAADFQAGRIEQSLAGFDRAALLSPAEAPFLWQRGIAQFYAGKFRDCRDMFISHRTVNPDDVENAAWHFLCVAMAESPEAARQQLLPVGTDMRAPMHEIYQMFQGRLKPPQVLLAAGSNPTALFYARLYIGLYLEATGDRAGGREHLAIAAQDRYAREGGYMHDVARVHLMKK
jgi:lipoprotein NlpI